MLPVVRALPVNIIGLPLALVPGTVIILIPIGSLPVPFIGLILALVPVTILPGHFPTSSTGPVCVQLADVVSIVVEHLALIDNRYYGAASEGEQAEEEQMEVRYQKLIITMAMADLLL